VLQAQCIARMRSVATFPSQRGRRIPQGVETNLVQLANRIARQFSNGTFRHVIVLTGPFKGLNGLRAFDLSDHHYGRNETRCLALKTNSVVEADDGDDFGAGD
jgi:hypothetical protein